MQSGQNGSTTNVWPSLPPLVNEALEDPDRGLLVLDPRLRLAYITVAAKRLLGVPEQVGNHLDLTGLLLETDLDDTSKASIETLVFQAREKKLVDALKLFRSDKSGEIWMRARAIGPRYVAVAISAVNSEASGDVAIGQTERRDALTGLLTRLHFEKAVLSALSGSTENSLAILLIDLDRFKPVNDTLGHAAGDSLLRLVGSRLQSVVRATDRVARLGGDEFALLIHPLSPAADPANIARRLCDLIGRTFLVDGHLINVGASVGIAVAPQHGSSYEGLLRCADLALYYSKVHGRGGYHFFSGEMEARAQARRTSELDLRRALAMRQLEIHYQPQVNLQPRELLGFEALVRWRHPEKGLIPPNDFLPLAEEIGVIVPIGDWVLKTACREAMKWPDHIVIAVNVSPLQFETGHFAETVRKALAATKLPARRLEIEVTEGILLRKKEAVLETMEALRAMGIRIAMDDFGTGHASLSQLALFAFDKIKIDRSLVGPDGANAKNRAIVRAIAALGASLGVSTMAEGIETQDQLERIQSDGCGSVQGYFFSGPMLAAQLESWMVEQVAKALNTKPGKEEDQDELQSL